MAPPANWSMVRVVGWLTDDDNAPLADHKLRFTSTAARLQDTVSHRLMVPASDTVTPSVTDGYWYIDRLSDSDPDVKPSGRQTKVELLRANQVLQTWWVRLAHDGPGVVKVRFDATGKIVTTGGTEMDAVYLDSLDDFTEAPITGTATIASHVAAPDPHPQYTLTQELMAGVAREPELILTGTVTRNAAGAATASAVTWPDGTPGTYSATTVNATNAALVDAYTITYGSPVTRTFTQPAVTRRADGAITARPPMTVS